MKRRIFVSGKVLNNVNGNGRRCRGGCRRRNTEAEPIVRSASDRIGTKRLGYREDPDPLFLTCGPKTRREFLNLLSWKGGKLGD
jgi:hypothetical protein